MSRTTIRQNAARLSLLIPLLAACMESPTGLETEMPAVVMPPSLSTTFTGNIRLGMVPGASTVQIGGADGFVIRDRVTGSALMSGANENAAVTYVNTSAPGKTSWRLLTKSCVTEAARDLYIAQAAAVQATKPDFVTYAERRNACWNVYLFDVNLSAAFSTLQGLQVQAVQQGLARNVDQWARVTVVATSKGFKIVKGATSVITPNFIAVEPANGRVRVEGREVNGSVEVFLNAAGTLTAVNELPLEEYLRGVVPLVLPPDYYGAAEAQKAQAVAERTRALYNFGRRRAAQGFDFYPGEYQPYGGPAVEHPVSTAAIDATAGMVAKFEGQLIDTPFHPSSGGWTANSEDVFGPVVPYLRGINEVDLPWGLQKKLSFESFSSSGATDLRGVPREDRGYWKRFNHWTVDWTTAELAAVLSSSFGVSVGNVTAVRVVERGVYGRVRRIEFDTDVGTLVAEKHDIRSKLRWITLEGDLEPLCSTLFYIAPVLSADQVTGFRAYGAGLGHGVGMSQLGAAMMAERGESHTAILSRYYTGATIEQR